MSRISTIHVHADFDSLHDAVTALRAAAAHATTLDPCVQGGLSAAACYDHAGQPIPEPDQTTVASIQILLDEE